MSKESTNKLAQEASKTKIDDLVFVSHTKQYNQYKSEPPKRWFNTTVCVLIAIIGVCVGISVAQIIYHFCNK